MPEKGSLQSKVTKALYQFDKSVFQECGGAFVGIDEAGRGSLAGPVIAAAVVLDLDNPVCGVNDSKKLTAQKREALYEKITKEAIGWAVGSASPLEIDRINILQASLLAMYRAVEKLNCQWNIALVDGNKDIPMLDKNKQRTVVGGDARSASIAAASIIAKVTRDSIMNDYNKTFPLYEFHNNKGYATEHHRKCVEDYGMCSIHRRSFCEVLASQTRLPL
ncbi:MAG TPA: ribonuclease HII [Chitinispirillaceae bacterium]|nr:ribonuclease HII [Chitinispirillaceae bacterium]